MKKKQFMSKLAALTMAAAMGITTLPATAVFAADVVSVDASDAKTVTSPEVSVNDITSDAYQIKTDLEGATLRLENGAKGTSRNASDWTVTSEQTNTYKYDVKSVSVTVPGMNAAGNDVDDIKITLVVDVATNPSSGTSEGKGQATVTFSGTDANAVKLTADEKITVLKTYIEAKIAKIDFADSDNGLTVKDKIGNLPTNVRTDIAETGGTAEGDSTLADYSVEVGTATKATSSTEGSLPITVTYTASDYVKADNTVTESKKTGTSSVTGKIPKTKTQNDGTYAQKIQNAIAAATWTSDDFTTAGSTTTLNTSTTAGTAKLVNVIKAVDNNTYANIKNDGTLINVKPSTFTYTSTTDDSNTGVTVSRYTPAEHGKDGFAHLQFFTARNDGGDNKVDSFDVDITIKEGDAAVQNELVDAFTKALKTDLKVSDLQSGNTAASQADIVDGIKKVIDARLAKSVNGKTYASDIKGYEIVVPDKKYVASTVDKFGNIQFYIKVDTGRTSTTDPTKTDVWYFGIANPFDGHYDTTTGREGKYANAVDNTAVVKTTKAAAENELFGVDGLAKLGKSEATGIALPDTISYNVKAAGKVADVDGTSGISRADILHSDNSSVGIALEDYVKVTPKDANNWKIRWTNSNTTDYALVGKDATGADEVETTLTTAKANDLPTLKLINDAATTVITAELLDDDGNVIATAKTTVTAKNGFDDVQNASYFAYNDINALTSTLKKVDKTGAQPQNGKWVNNGNYNTQIDVEAGKELKSSPVIAGVGNNRFDPYADVSRGQFITFLWRNAVNEYSFADATTQAYTKDPASYTGKTDFADVDETAYYAKAVEWAADNGIAFGDGTNFNPNKTITRAEAVSFIYRLKAQGAVYNNYQQFDDVSSSAYYANAVGYARSEGITAGKSGNKFAPGDTVTRGEAAAFILRMAAGESGFYTPEK